MPLCIAVPKHSLESIHSPVIHLIIFDTLNILSSFFFNMMYWSVPTKNPVYSDQLPNHWKKVKCKIKV